MPVKHRNITRRKKWSSSHLLQLRWGWDYFNDAWGDLADLPLDERAAWPSVATLAEMRDCWEQNKEQVVAEHAVQHAGYPLWAELVFDHGLSPQAALDAKRGST